MIKGLNILSLFDRPPSSLFRSVPLSYLSVQAGKNVSKFTERTHHCGELSRNNIGQRVSLFGWVKYTRFDNKIIALRDSYGTVQCVIDKSQLTRSFRKTAIHNESILRVCGVVRERPKDQANNELPTGAIEILTDSVTLLNAASKDLPMLTRESDPEHALVNKLRYRYLDIRSHTMQEALRLRSRVSSILRQILCELDFIECETPTLFRRTPGGANEFVVPTKVSNMFYSLTQSPQQLKQLLMVGGLDRYFQICRCYRDESGRTDRQPEFTQVDIELSFTNQDLVMDLISELMFQLFKNLYTGPDSDAVLRQTFSDTGAIPRMDYHEALRSYGCDKPDTRFGWLIEESVCGGLSIKVPHTLHDDTIVGMLRTIRDEKYFDTEKYRPAISRSVSDGNSTLITLNSCNDEARKILGQLRLSIASHLAERGKQVYKSKFRFIWITGFPLFEYNDTTQTFESSHHPFTAPTPETLGLLGMRPQDVIGQHYDLVLNGQEVAGGSVRIHDPKLQRRIFRDILKLDDQTFNFFIEALESGCPPHGGIAIGFDRLIAIILNRDSIRDVIAFPKSNIGRDLMSGCPHELDDQTKRLYHVK